MAGADCQGGRCWATGKLLKTPWGHLRGQAWLQGVKLPPLGTFQDAYLQALVADQLNREVVRTRTLIYANWSVVGGDAGKQATDLTVKSMEEYQQRLFPHMKGTTSVERDQRDIKIMEQFLKQIGWGRLIKAKEKAKPNEGEAKDEKPPGMWQQIWGKLKGKDKE